MVFLHMPIRFIKLDIFEIMPLAFVMIIIIHG